MLAPPVTGFVRVRLGPASSPLALPRRSWPGDRARCPCWRLSWFSPRSGATARMRPWLSLWPGPRPNSSPPTSPPCSSSSHPMSPLQGWNLGLFDEWSLASPATGDGCTGSDGVAGGRPGPGADQLGVCRQDTVEGRRPVPARVRRRRPGQARLLGSGRFRRHVPARA
jgi:hypothetical protein